MISFRKHARESTRRPNLFLASPSRAAYAAACVSALLSLLLFAPSGDAAQGRKRKSASKAHAGAPSKKKAAPVERGDEADGKGDEAASVPGGNVPVRVERIDTAEGPVVVATIGEFPSDLNEAGQEFLRQEFFQHFASDTLGLDESDPKAATLKVAMLPQEKENRREGDFTFGKVSGHMLVVVERRHVYVACALTKAAVPQMLARAVRAASGEGAAE